MAGYPVIDPDGVDILNVDGSTTHYNLGETVPLSSLISRRYSWLVERGYLSETEIGFGGTETDLTDVEYIGFNTATPYHTPTLGQITWNGEEGTLDLALANDVIYENGMKLFMPPTKNNSGVQINKGEFVMATGAQGDRITIAKAVTDGSVDPQYMIGVAASDIPNGSETGLIIVYGILKGIDTDLWPVGTILYPDPTTPGWWTSTQPAAPSIKTSIAIVLRQQENTGRIYVRMTNGSVLGGTDSNVQFTTLADNDILTYDSTQEYWKNQNLAAAVDEVGGSITGLSNYLPLTGGTLTGDLVIGDGTTSATLTLSSEASSDSVINFRNAGVTRWRIYNDGDDYDSIKIDQHNAAGNFTGNALTISGATGQATFSNILKSLGQVNAANTTDSTSTTTGSIVTAGGLGVAKNLYVGSKLSIATAGYLQLENTTLDRIVLWGTKDAANAYAIGIENYTQYYRSYANHRWYINTAADDGATDVMELTSSQLAVNTTGKFFANGTVPAGTTNVLTADGTLDTTTGWTINSGWSIAGGEATVTAGAGTLESATTATTGYSYIVTVSMTRTSGSGNMGIYVDDLYISYGSTTDFSLYFTPKASNPTIKLTPTSAWAGTVYSVEVKRLSPLAQSLILYPTSDGGTVSYADIRVTPYSGNAGYSLYFGRGAGAYSGSNGYYSVGIGYNALLTNAGHYNVGIGASALTNAGTVLANQNVAIGASALSQLRSGGNNVFIGHRAGYVNDYSAESVAIGAFSQGLNNNSTGTSNTSVGRSSLYQITTGSNNTAIGRSSFYGLITGSDNTAVGFNSGYYQTAGNYNTFLGAYAGDRINGTYNTSIGYDSGPTSVWTHDYGIFIGYRARPSADAASNEIVIGKDIAGRGSNTTLIGNASTTDFYPYGKLHVEDTTNSTSTTTGSVIISGGLGVAKAIYGGSTITSGSTSAVIAGTDGFKQATYVASARNPIWRFGNSDGYGLSYFQGSASIEGNDTIGFHFGTATAAASILQVNRNNVVVSGTTDSSSTTTGSLRTAGGLGIAKSAFIGNGATIMSPSLGFALKLDNAGSDGGTNAWWIAPTGGGYTAGDNKLVFLYNSASSGGSLLTIDGANLKTGIGYGNYNPSATLDVKSYLTTDIGLIVRGVLSQTANLQEWRNSTGTVLASVSSSGAFTAVTKSFDIEHPTKEGKRLRYGSLEGPENGVYVRGKNDSHVITLPDYWTGLVDPDSITVQLTSNGKFQALYVEEIKDNSVIVGGVEGEYFYFIQAERIDVDKLVVEYGS